MYGQFVENSRDFSRRARELNDDIIALTVSRPGANTYVVVITCLPSAPINLFYVIINNKPAEDGIYTYSRPLQRAFSFLSRGIFTVCGENTCNNKSVLSLAPRLST